MTGSLMMPYLATGRRISGEPEKGRLAERDDAGIAEDQIEREREQRQDRRIGQDQMLAGNSQMVAKAKIQNAISSGDQRARRAR
jgi:hypothetical protein